MDHSAFPSDETLAAFIDGQLDEEMRKKVVAHVAECDDCYGTIMAAGASIRDQQPGTVKPFGREPNRRYVGFAAAAAAIAGVLLLYPPVSARYAQRRDTAALREAVNELTERSVRARVSLDLEYKPTPYRYRGGSPDSEHWKVDAAAEDLRDDAERDARMVAQHSYGVGLLLAGKYQEAAYTLDKAILTETSAATLSDAINKSNDAPLLIDVSAAHCALSEKNAAAASTQVAIALAAADRALQLNPKSTKVLWNRAVALEQVDSKRAMEAWKSYIAVDPSSKWSDEARTRLQTLEDDVSADAPSVPQPDGLGARR